METKYNKEEIGKFLEAIDEVMMGPAQPITEWGGGVRADFETDGSLTIYIYPPKEDKSGRDYGKAVSQSFRNADLCKELAIAFCGAVVEHYEKIF